MTPRDAVATIARMRAAALLLLLGGCLSTTGPLPAGPASAPEREEPALPPPAKEYLTAARPDGVVGGHVAQQVAAAVAQALRERGAEAEPDGALAATAGWFLEETVEDRKHGPHDGERVARHFGFAGDLLTLVTFGLEGEHARYWREALTQLPRNVPVTRYGVRASPAGVAAVVFGSVEATLNPIPRHLRPGQSLHLGGEVGGRFAFAHVYLTGVDGKVEEWPQPTRKVDATLRFPVAGVYQVEVMGDGPTGPAVLVNVPVYVGVPEPAIGRGGPTEGPGAPLVDAEERLLSLLNAARAQAGLRPLASDPELRAVALGHSQEMATAHFLSHVSPTTGTLEDRLRRAGALLAAGGENISRASGAEAAHRDLMNSPGHRANMLSPKFTHVGIAVVPDGDQMIATLVFGRRPDPTAPFTARQALEAIAALRRAKNVPPVVDDPVLRAAAAAGIKAFTAHGGPAAMRETNAALGRETARRSPRRQAGGCVRLFEILDPDQLEQLTELVDPPLRRIGVAIGSRSEGRVRWLVLLLVTEGGKCEGPSGP